MSIPDELIVAYVDSATTMSVAEKKGIEEGLGIRDAPPDDGKSGAWLFQLVLQFHGEDAARGAQDEFDRVFKHGEHPDEMPEVRVSQDDLVDGKIAVSKLVVIAGLASSNSEARRLIEQGGVRIDDVRVEGVMDEVEPVNGMVINVGKRRYAKVIKE